MKLGELFVDLGVNSGGAFNTLSSFAFKLGNIANLGGTVTRCVDDFFGEAPKWASNMKMLSKNIDLSVQELQDLEESAKVSQVSMSSAIGFYKKLWSEYYNAYASGFQDEGYLEKWSKYFGPEIIDELTSGIQEPIELVNLLDRALSQVNNKADLMAIRDLFGMSAEMQQTFKLFSYGGIGATNLSDQEVKRLSVLKETIDTLSIESDRLHDKWLSKMAPMFTDWVKKLYSLKNGYYEVTESSRTFTDFIKDSLAYLTGAEWLWGKIFEWIDEKYPSLMKNLDFSGNKQRFLDDLYKKGEEANKKEKTQIYSSIVLDKPYQTMLPTAGTFSPVYNNTIYTDAGSVGKVIEQTTQTSINTARNGAMELMLGRGTI